MLIVVQLLEDSQAVLSLGKKGEESRYFFIWKKRETPFLLDKLNAECTLMYRLSYPVSLTLRTLENRLHQLLERLKPSREGISEGASSSTDDVPTPAKPPLMRTSARPSLNKPGGKHNLHTHFPKDPKCDVCKRTKITRAFCKKNCGRTKRSSNADKIKVFITADQKVFNEENNSRLRQRSSAVVQDLATQWIQSYPRKK